MSERGFYSIVQFVPDVGRAEGANVGIALVCPATGKVAVRMAENNEGPKRRFLASSFDQARLTQAKTALANRIGFELKSDPSLERLKKLAALEGNALLLTAPRTVAVDDIDATARELFIDLVFLPVTSRDRSHLPKMKQILDFLRERNAPIDELSQVEIPISGEHLKVSFSYLNGAKHYVHPQGFPRDPDQAIERAQKVGAQGHLLYSASENKPIKDKLVVVGRFADATSAGVISEMLKRLHVRLVNESEMMDFANEVVTDAH